MAAGERGQLNSGDPGVELRPISKTDTPGGSSDHQVTISTPDGVIGTRPRHAELLDRAIEESQWNLEAHQQRVAFYVSLISALVAGTIAGAMSASESSDYLLLVAGPVLSFGVCRLAIEGAGRFYQRFLEAVATRTKLEDECGLSSCQAWDRQRATWPSEPLVPTRHLKARQKYQSSQDFIDEHQKSGYHAPTIKLFEALQVTSALLAVGLVALAIQSA